MRLFVALLIALLFNGLLSGHPAEAIKISFDSTATILTVNVIHPVKNIENHYISSIVIDINGKEKIKQNFNWQFNETEQLATYRIFDLKKGDKINITTQCNRIGKKKESFVYSIQ